VGAVAGQVIDGQQDHGALDDRQLAFGLPTRRGRPAAGAASCSRRARRGGCAVTAVQIIVYQAPGASLRKRSGLMPRADRGEALRRLGVRELVHPDDVVAMLYPSQAVADEFAKSNLEGYGHPCLGSYETLDGVVGMTDLRQVLLKPTDPTLDDLGHRETAIDTAFGPAEPPAVRGIGRPAPRRSRQPPAGH
jgi:hypothetical protein